MAGVLQVTVTDIVPKELLASLTEEMVEAVTGDITASARNHWIGLAQKNLHTSRNDYVNAIQEVQFRPGVAVITLLGQPANLIENGGESVDLRKWLLGPNVPEAPFGQKGKRRAKDGTFYRAIPFRHGTPGTGGSVGKAMGDPYQGVVKDAKKLGRAVYNQAKKLKAGQRLPAGLAKKLKEHHTVDIYAGMIKQRKTYKSATQSQYMTFRMISQRHRLGWIRPATQGVGFAQQTADFITRLAPVAFQSYVNGLGTT